MNAPLMTDGLNRPYVYVAWIRDFEHRLDTPGAEESPRIYLIDSPSAAQAQEWGDTMLLHALREKPELVFIRSNSHSIGDPDHAQDASWSTTPRCTLGESLSDEALLAPAAVTGPRVRV